MVVVVSNATALVDEPSIINQLFDAGLTTLHLRKPDYTIQQTEDLLLKISNQHYSKIALHQHHQLIEKFSLHRIHYTEAGRSRLMETDLTKQIHGPKIISTSIHHITQYKELLNAFDYCFFGPVFNSISKQGYQSVRMEDFQLPENRKIKIIALGGIDENKIDAVKDFGFSGIALLGAIWQSKRPVEQFIRIQEKWHKKEIAY